MKAAVLLKENIDELLRRRNQHRKDLAQWCYRSESWISKIFRTQKRELPQKYLDRIADFFGLSVYQLFQPGIGKASERRVGERRTGKDRRITNSVRLAQTLGASIDAIHPRRHALIHESPTIVEGKRLTAEYERRISALLAEADAGRQAPQARQGQSKARARRRMAGGSDVEKR